MRFKILIILGILIAKYGILARNITLGAFFNVFDSKGDVNYYQLEMMTAFVFAINEINANSSILSNYNLTFAFGAGNGFAEAAVAGAKLSQPSYHLLGGVTGFANVEAEALLQSMGEAEIPVGVTFASSPLLGYNEEYSWRFQTNPLTSYEGNVLQDIIVNYFNITRVVVFCSNDEAGYSTYDALVDNSFGHLEVLSTLIYASYDKQFSSQISAALATGATAFVIIGSAESTAKILEAGYNRGLFRSNIQVFCTSSILLPEFFSYFSTHANIGSILKGTITVDFWPDYDFIQRSSLAMDFLTKWTSQSPSQDCHSITDSFGYSYLFPNGDKSKNCVGLDFSSYSLSKLPSSYVLYVYDAVYALAHALDFVVSQGMPLNGNNILDSVLKNVSFYGSSGFVDFHDDFSSRSYYGRGNRKDGVHYMVLNFHDDQYNINPNNSYVFIADWSEEHGTEFCDFMPSCYPVLYNTDNNKPPSGLPPFALAKSPDVIKIGGLFELVNSNGIVNLDQLDCLNSFLLAIRQINNKTDGIADDILPHSRVVFASRTGLGYYGAVVSAEELYNSFYYSGIQGVISAEASGSVMASGEYFAEKKLVQVHSNAQDSSLGDGTRFPYKVQTCPVDSYEGMVLQNIACDYFGLKKVFVFYDYAYSELKTALEANDGTFCSFSSYKTGSLNPATNDFSAVIESAKSTGYLVFFLFCSVTRAAKLLEDGYSSGLFHEGTQIFFSKTSVDGIMNHFSASADVTKLMKGVIYIDYWPNYSVNRTTIGRTYLKNWRETNIVVRLQKGRNLLSCVSGIDDSGAQILEGISASEMNRLCIEANTTNFLDRDDFFNVSTSAALTYDATFSLIYGIDILLKKGNEINGDNLMEVLLNNVSFEGVTGNIKFSKGMSSYGNYARGDREVGYHYRIMNFNADAYAIDPSNSFVQVMVWSEEDGVQPCDSMTSCSDIIYNTKHNADPIDTPLPIVRRVSLFIRLLFVILGVVVIFVSIILGLFIFSKRKLKFVRISQPDLIYCTLFGEILSGVIMILLYFEYSDGVCILTLWLIHFSFNLVFGTLFLKMYRIYLVLHKDAMVRYKSSNFRTVGSFVVGLIGYLLILTFVGKPHVEVWHDFHQNQLVMEYMCRLVHPEVHSVLFLLEAGLIFFGARISWVVRDAPDAVNESHFNAMAMGIMGLLALAAIPILYLLLSSPIVERVFITGCIGFATLNFLFLFFSQKIWKILSGDYEVDGHLNLSRKTKISPEMFIDPPSVHAPIKFPSVTATSLAASTSCLVESQVPSVGNNPLAQAFVFDSDILKHYTINDQLFVFCKLQVNAWKQILLTPQETSKDQEQKSTGEMAS